jgi:ribosome maturation factor RimP
VTQAIGRSSSKTALALDALIRPIVEQLGCELWGHQYFQQGRYSTLRIYIDGPAGVTVEDCQRVSAQVRAVLDVENPITGQYSLEVSSPGLDRALFTQAHYERFVGHRIQLKLHSPIDERRNFTGTLQAVANNSITMNVDGIEYQLSFDTIEKANLVPEI